LFEVFFFRTSNKLNRKKENWTGMMSKDDKADIQQSLPASPCFHFAINRSHFLAAVRLAATILGIRSESIVCRQRFGMRSSACVKIIHRAPVTILRPSSKNRA
jgi:hypothetical protein